MVLKKREKEILRLVCRQWTNQQIAERMERDIKTIESVVSELLLKTKSNNRVGLAMFAIKQGIYKIKIKNNHELTKY